MCFRCLVLSEALAVPAQQPKSDTDAAVSEELQAIERDWLNTEKNHDAAAFEKIVADDWIAITPDGKRQTKAQRAVEIKAARGATSRKAGRGCAAVPTHRASYLPQARGLEQ
jgi:Domain of unknown function (DUF4440)